jgi:cytochrome c5
MWKERMRKRRAAGIEAVEKGSSFTTYHALTVGGRRYEKMVWLIVFSVFHLLAADTFSQESKDIYKPQQHRHEEYTKVKNPVPMTKQSVAQGEKVYEKHCQSCHGESGKGDSGPDLADTIWIHGNADGEIFNVVTHGVEGTAMRGFEKELTKEMRWHLVNYIKSLGKTEGRR